MKEQSDGSSPVHASFDLSGKAALVTGGAVGLGKAFAEALAEYGARVAIADVDESAALDTAARLQNAGTETLVIAADVSRPEHTERMVRETVARFGTIDILVNNAGVTAKGVRIHEMPLEVFDNVMSINLRGVFLCTRATLPVMLQQKRGVIINIASAYSLRTFFAISQLKPNAPYITAKSALIGLTKETAVEYARDGIRANAIVPGWIQGTRLTAALQGPDNASFMKQYDEVVLGMTPMGRKGNPDELKALAVYLASDASAFVTGQYFVVDGGITL